MGVFNRILAELAARAGYPDQLLIDATHLKAHRTAASLLKKGLYPDVSGRSRGGLTSKLQVVCDGKGRPLLLYLTEGQANDHKAADALLERLLGRRLRQGIVGQNPGSDRPIAPDYRKLQIARNS
jgi:Transposase DDE domain